MLYFKIPIPTKFIFSKPLEEKGALCGFSSVLHKIGIENDVVLQNGCYVEVLSEPLKINSPKYGELIISKIQADVSTDYHTITKVCWIPTQYITEIKEINEHIN